MLHKKTQIVISRNGRPLNKVQKGALPVCIQRELKRLSHLIATARG